MLVLTNAEGARGPCQIDGDTLSFVAWVPKGRSSTYTLRPDDSPMSVLPMLGTKVRKDALIISNEHLAVRMPAPKEETFAEPIDAAKATPPILAWAGRDGAWMGGARFVTARKIASQAFRVVREGPAVVEYEARYVFAPKGEYVWRLRLSPWMPIAVITEEFDFGQMTEGEDCLLLDVHRGWRPAHIGWAGGGGEQQIPSLRAESYDAYVAGKRGAEPVLASVGGVGEAPQPRMPEKAMMLLEKILPAGEWGDTKCGLTLWDGDAEKPGFGRHIGIVPLSPGSWRRTLAVCAWYQQEAGLSLALPLGVRWARWSIEVTDDHSPFSTHEHDPGLRRPTAAAAGDCMREPKCKRRRPGSGTSGWIVTRTGSSTIPRTKPWPSIPGPSSRPGRSPNFGRCSTNTRMPSS